MPIQKNTTRAKAVYQGALTFSEELYTASTLDVEVGVFDADGSTPADLSDFTGFAIEFETAQWATGEPLIYGTATDDDLETLTDLAAWEDGSEQHLTFSWTAQQTNINLHHKASRDLYVVLYGTSSAGRVILATGTVTIYNSNAGSSAAAETPDLYDTSAEVDAKIAAALADFDAGENLPGRIDLWLSDETHSAYDQAADTDAARGDALRTALAAADTFISAGANRSAILRMGPGRYATDRTIVFNEKCAIVGAGGDQTVIYDAYSGSPTNGALMVNKGYNGTGYTGGTGVYLADFGVEITRYNGIVLAHVSRGIVKGIRGNMTGSVGGNSNTFHFIDLCGCERITVTECHADHAYDNATMQIDQAVSTAWTGWNGSATFAMTTGADNTGCEEISIIHYTSYTAGGSGKHIEIHRDNHAKLIFKGCSFQGGITGITTDTDNAANGLSRITITDCHAVMSASNAYCFGIMGGSSDHIDTVTIANCTGSGGLRLVQAEYVDHLKVIGCDYTSTAAAGQGVYLQTAGNDAFISLSAFRCASATSDSLIEIDANWDNVGISAVHLVGSTGSTGIAANGTNIWIDAVKIEGVSTQISGTGRVDVPNRSIAAHADSHESGGTDEIDITTFYPTLDDRYAQDSFEASLSNTTPSPPATGVNVLWQETGAAPNVISGYINAPDLHSKLDHDSISGFVANEHVDHSAVSISAGTGLDGGGDLTTSRTLSLDSSYIGQFDDDAPAAPAGAVNVKWQETGSGPTTISAYLDVRGTPGLFGFFLPAEAMTPNTTGGPARAQLETSSEGINVVGLDFDAASTEIASVQLGIPSMFLFTSYTAQFLWTTAATAGTGNVVWATDARVYSNDDAIDQAMGTAQTATDAFIADGDVHLAAATSAVTPAGGTPAVGDLVVMQFARLGANGSDTYTQDARLLGVYIEFS